MSGNSGSPSRDTHRHIQAARDWLDRAEDQFNSGMDVMASANLMLAQAELKIMVENVAAGEIITTEESRPKPVPIFRLPVTRTIIGVAAMAACMVIGLFIGKGIVPTDLTSPEPTGTGITIASLPDIPTDAGNIPDTAVIPDTVEPVDEHPGMNPADELEEVLGVSTPEPEEVDTPSVSPSAPAPASTEPVYHPSPVIEQPTETPTVNVSDPSLKPESFNPEPVDDTPEESGVEPVSDDAGIVPAEVALNTVRFLSERLVSQNVE